MNKSLSRPFISLRLKLLIGFTMLFSGMFSFAYYWFYNFATQQAIDHIEADLIATTKGGIQGINGDEFERLAKIEVPEGQTIPANHILYQEHQAWLDKIHRVEPRAIPYTFIQGRRPDEVFIIGDELRAVHPERATSFRQSYINADSQIHQGLVTTTIILTSYSDDLGTWISAYAPIYNSEAQIVGGLGIDFKADYVTQMQRSIRDRVVVAFVIAYGVLLVLVFALSGIFTRHLRQLAQFVTNIGDGKYENQPTFANQNRFSDEMDILVKVFSTMVDRIRVRERSLQQLNAELEDRVQKRTVELQIANHQLTDSLGEKELLLKEVHHRVKNNLQVISSIFSLQTQYVKTPEVLSILTDAQSRIRSMALIHEKLYQSPSLMQIDFADYIRSLARNLFTSYNISPELVELSLQISDVSLNLDTAIPCGLIINELVTNSLKYAFPDQQCGEVMIAFSETIDDTQPELCLLVRDNGVGLPVDLDIQNTNSLGFRLVRALTMQIRGKLVLLNDKGAVFQITFPKPKYRPPIELHPAASRP